jgi:hypothetical protein
MDIFPPIETPKHSVLARLPGALPLGNLPKDTDAYTVAKLFVQHLANLEPDHFIDDAVWRDTFALTGSLRTFYSKCTVFSVLAKLLEKHAAHSFALLPESCRVIQVGSSCWVDAVYTFETGAAGSLPTACSLYLSLVAGGDGKWRVWVVKSILEGLLGQADVDKPRPRPKEDCGSGCVKLTDSRVVDVVVVGGSQAGLSLGGHLQALGVSYVVLEKNEKVGDAWRLRYDSARRMLLLVSTRVFYSADKVLETSVHTIKEYCEFFSSNSPTPYLSAYYVQPIFHLVEPLDRNSASF